MFRNLFKNPNTVKTTLFFLSASMLTVLLVLAWVSMFYQNESAESKVPTPFEKSAKNKSHEIKFEKIETPTCIIVKAGVMTEVSGDCEGLQLNNDIEEQKEPIIEPHNPKVIHPDNTKYYDIQYDKAVPDENILAEISKTYGLPEMTLYYQMMVEGRGKVNATKNSSGAKGYHQFLDNTAIEFGLIADGVDHRTNPYASADAAARYLLWIGQLLYGDELDLSDADMLTHALAAYNAGHRKVSVNGQVRVPRFYETIRYTQNIIDLIEGNATLIMPNETLSQISARTGFPVDVLVQSNFGIKSDEDLKAFEVMQLPLDGVSKVIVRRGMSLSMIGRRTGATVSDIKILNNLSSDLIRPSDIIMIPTSLYVKG